MQDFNQAAAFLNALGADTACFRMIHDSNPGVPAVNLDGKLSDIWNNLCAYNALGYGAFVCINQMIGGRRLENVSGIRAHFVDLDNFASAEAMYHAAAGWHPAPGFAVLSSPGKFHVYWPVNPYLDIAGFTQIQQKLRVLFDGDAAVGDAARVMRLPGTWHMKRPDAPHLVTCHALPGYGQRCDVAALANALQGVQIDPTAGAQVRTGLGEAKHAAPSLALAIEALSEVDPNGLGRADWITVTAAFKQSVWTLCSADDAFKIWSDWCAQYTGNDPAENWKQWNDIQRTQVGWTNLVNRAPSTKAKSYLGGKAYFSGAGDAPPPMPTGGAAPSAPVPGGYLTGPEQAALFKNCFFVERYGTILTDGKRQLNQTQFNGKFGGYMFMINDVGGTTDDAWKAATRSRLGTIPKVDHLRFLPSEPSFGIVQDDLGRLGVNTYIPARIERRAGDVSPFLRHMEFIIPDAGDRKIYLDYMAHNAKFPGHKIPWAPLIQSEEGAGKGVIKLLWTHLMGASYTYFPNAQQLVNTGSKFNAWMRERLFILVDEIKVDERRDLIEVLKPMISEAEIEIEGKGKDQDKEDNYSNWAFFSNYKDAIPIRANGRRYAIFYSAIQSLRDLQARGMDQTYFERLYNWTTSEGGKEAVAEWFARYPIERGQIPMRAPDTTSTASALEQSRSPLEVLIGEAVADARPGFKSGFASSLALRKVAQDAGIKATAHGINKALEAAGYHKLGRASREYAQEKMGERATIWATLPETSIEWFGRMQGYE